MSFEAALHDHFPGALPVQAALSRVGTALYRHGFSRSQALAIVSLCRDEISGPLLREIQQGWGDVFHLGGLAGMPAGGRTALGAALDHAPRTGGRERVVCLALTHIALGRDGEIGVCARAGRTEPSKACGALVKAQARLVDGPPPPTVDPDDAEFALLLARLAPRVAVGTPVDLVTLTRTLHDVIADDLARLLQATVDPGRTDYAVATGILVHGPQGRDHTWPGQLYVVMGGQRSDLALG
jgi:hypothetical protein